jgi:ankyrin repeat protein
MDARELPAHPDLEQFKKQAKELVRAYKGDEQALQKIIRQYQPEREFTAEEFREKIQQRLRRSGRAKLERDKFTLADAQFLIAREYGFESWPRFAKHVEGIGRKNSPISKFELAVEAVIGGDAKTLKRLLGENPKLIRERSTRTHSATLLHYVGANGVENYRQKTPKNAAEIAKILLEAGAEVDAMAEMYGGSTTLGLIATSLHPYLAGVQNDLIEVFLRAGAAIDHPKAGGNEQNAVNGCLANGRGEAAVYLAERGAKLDLEGAAGIGRLDVVKSFFDEDGRLKAGATQVQMERGFCFACGYGRNDVIEFLLERGVDIHAGESIDQTGLHWAVFSAQIDTIKLLLKHGARLEALNNYGGDALDQALWCLVNNENAADFIAVIETLLEAGAGIEPGTLGWLARQPKPSAAVKAQAEEILRRFGAEA